MQRGNLKAGGFPGNLIAAVSIGRIGGSAETVFSAAARLSDFALRAGVFKNRMVASWNPAALNLASHVASGPRFRGMPPLKFSESSGLLGLLLPMEGGAFYINI
jgi:hypothetical protein